ncbi:MAG: Transcriptional regulator, MarR family [uncultured Thermomicrobiales bacterium]|uniref:Transcriptional regulator, MarR family n=1 Tax=uncultured Thermomicrobiales bacterium TaxID=1645740 RepID=A0A6J4VFN8_9BACT|nr:MAG: Transcriptional regulator, MarR family [uncultured Thermomicrobiales bacterium]
MSDPPRGLPSSALLRLAYNALAARIYSAVVSGTAFEDLRPAHGNAMEQLELEDGLRLTDMAMRAGMTAQSMGELVDDLERKGYLERRPDPNDRRAKRIYLTARGRENARIAKQATTDVEAQLATLLGARRYQTLRRALEEIIAAGGGGEGQR